MIGFVLFALLGALLYGAMMLHLNEAMDTGLRARASILAAFLNHKDVQGQLDSLPKQLQEHTELPARGELLLVTDVIGQVIYETMATRSAGVSIQQLSGTPCDITGSDHRVYRSLSFPVPLKHGTVLAMVASDQTEYRAALHSLGSLLILGIPIALLLAAAAGFWMSRRALVPMRDMANTLRSINSQRLSVRLPLSGSADELDQLSETANTMLNSLHDSFDRITRFTADASHELRTPLSLISGHGEMLSDDASDPEKVRVHAIEILEQTARMQLLIEDLLILARSDSGEDGPSLEVIDPAELAARAALIGSRMAAGKGVDFYFLPIAAVSPIYGNDEALYRVLIILFDNAIRHTLPGGRVSLELSCSSVGSCFVVRDSGSGIKPESLPRIFERFFREDSSRDRASGGTGLGLSIAKAIVVAHGGWIAAQSELAVGSSFTVSLPSVPQVEASS